MYDVSVIVTTYNAEDTVNRAVSSLLHKPFMERIEVIIVDDCSKDGTPQIIQSIAEKNDNVKVILLDKNTGSPSEPRNVGMRNATGEYITFLDDDDWLDVKNLLELVQYAKANGLECVKGYLSVVDKKGVTISNRIVDRKYNTIIKDILAQQSTTIDVVLKREFLVKHQIAFDKSYKIGEDTLFYAECFSKNPKIEYVDKSYYFYNKSRGVELSTTQQYGDRELEMHIEIWNLVEEKLKSVGISYYQLRLSVAVKNSVKNLVVEESKLVSKKVFLLFSEFLNKEKAYLKNKVYLEQRYQEVLDTLYAGDYQKFCQVSKKRILIAGYDLKFILPLVSYLEQHYMVLIDEWTGHNSHNEKQSKELLEQADIIWCEWLLGNAVWYSQQKKNYQKIIIRAHRFEITREFGYQVNYDKVSKVLAVGYYYLEEFQRKFHIPRSKMQLLSNYVEPDIYTGEKNEGYQYHIGIVGILPKRKGFFKGLEILKNLRQKDERFQLYVVGAKPEDTDWIMNNPTEKSYYQQCSQFIKENNLEEAVIYKGWMQKQEMFRDLAFVLSLSDDEQPESFHLTPAEAYCDNTMGLFLSWPGVEYIYPQQVIFGTVQDIEDFILKMVANKEENMKLLMTIKEYIIANYDVKLFCEKVKTILETL